METPPLDIPPEWSPHARDTIFRFCHGRLPDSLTRCDHYLKNYVCPVAGMAQLNNAVFKHCELAHNEGRPGIMDEYGFLSSTRLK